MKEVSYVYNALNRWVRRIIDRMKSWIEFQQGVALLLITIGFSLLTVGVVNDSSTLTNIGAIGVIAGIVFTTLLYIELRKETKKQENKEEQRHKELLAELKTIVKVLKKK